MSRARVWRAGQQVAGDFAAGDLPELFADPQHLIWFDLADPTAAELAELAGELGLSGAAVEDALAPGERPKAHRHGGRLFVQAYAIRLGADRAGSESALQTGRISAFVLPNALITVRIGEVFEVAELLERWELDTELVAAGVGGLLHGLLDLVVDSHDAVIAELDEAMEALEDLLFADRHDSAQLSRDAYRLRRELVEVRRVALPMREVVDVVIRYGRESGWSPDLHSHYEDLYDHVLRAAEWTESLRDLVGSIFETNLSLNDMRLNIVMKKLSGWAAIIAVPTLITGWFGMNVPYPGFGMGWGFWLALGASVATAVVLYIVFRRHDWL